MNYRNPTTTFCGSNFSPHMTKANDRFEFHTYHKSLEYEHQRAESQVVPNT